MPIRVLHVVASSRGGGATHVLALATGLDRERFAVAVAMPEDGGQVEPSAFESIGIPVEPVDIAQGFRPTQLHRLQALAANASIVHVHGARAALLGRIPVAPLRTRSDSPRVVYTVHGLALPYYRSWRRLAMLTGERVLRRWTDAIIAVSENERQALLELGLGCAGDITVVRNGIDPRPFELTEIDRNAARAALGIPADATVITCICRLHKPRDLETMVRAFARAVMYYPDAFLLIVGDGPDRPQVEALRDGLHLRSRVVLAGQRYDIPRILAASDAFTLTTWGWEGMPITVLEAMAAGLPVIATEAGGIPELVIAEQTGLLVPRRDAAALATGYERLLGDPALRSRMGTAGRERVRAAFTLESMVEGTSEVYERVLRRPAVHTRPRHGHGQRQGAAQ